MRPTTRPPTRTRQRGMTLLEIIVSIGILAMIGLLIYGAFDSLNRGRKGEAIRTDRARQGRQAVLRIARELESAFLSAHNPQAVALATRTSAFFGQNGSPFDRLDFGAFVHQRFERDAKESDQCEIGYFAVRDPDASGEKMDLVRREQTPADFDAKRGGVVNVLAENIELFDVKFLDPLSGSWIESWDTTQVSMQLNRLPMEIKIVLTLKGAPNGTPSTYSTKVMLPISQPLTFAVPR